MVNTMQLPGFHYMPDVLSAKEQEQVLGNTRKLHNWKTAVSQGRIHYFGYELDSDYAYGMLNPTDRIPRWGKRLLQTINDVDQKSTAGDPDQMTVIELFPNASIGNHIDASVYGDEIWGITLESARDMQFILKKKELEDRDIRTEAPPCSVLPLAEMEIEKESDTEIVLVQSLAVGSLYKITNFARYHAGHGVLAGPQQRTVIGFRHAAHMIG